MRRRIHPRHVHQHGADHGLLPERVSQQPTYSGTAAAPAAFTTPGLVLTNPINMVGGHIQIVDGKARLYLAGTYHLGNDPYTGAAWNGPLAGDFVADYGPYKAGSGNAGKWTYEAQGLAVQYNGGLPNTNDFGGPILDNSWASNWAGLYWVEAAVKYWVSDNTNIALGYGHSGLLPSTVLPASNGSCPGCVVSGYSQNAAFLQVNLGF